MNQLTTAEKYTYEQHTRTCEKCRQDKPICMYGTILHQEQQIAELQQEHERLRKDSERLEFAMERLFIIDQRNKETFDRGGTVRIYDTRGALDAALGEKE